jgi:hypothetical protein
LDDAGKRVVPYPTAGIGVWNDQESRSLSLGDSDAALGRTPSAASPDMFISRQRAFWSFPPALGCLLWAHGAVGVGSRPTSTAELRPKYEPEIFTVAGRATLRGTSCTVLKTIPISAANRSVEEIWVDRSALAAVRQIRVVVGDKHLSSSSEADYQTVEAVSVAKSWKRSTFFNGQLVQEYRMRVTAVTPKYLATDKDFRLDPKPGMFVKREAEIFEVKQSGEWKKVGTDKETQRVIENLERQQLPAESDDDTIDPGSSADYGRWFFFGTLGAATLGAFVLLRRRPQRNSA